MKRSTAAAQPKRKKGARGRRSAQPKTRRKKGAQPRRGKGAKRAKPRRSEHPKKARKRAQAKAIRKEKWAQRAFKPAHRGWLHDQLGIPRGEKIGMVRLDKAYRDGKRMWRRGQETGDKALEKYGWRMWKRALAAKNINKGRKRKAA